MHTLSIVWPGVWRSDHRCRVFLALVSAGPQGIEHVTHQRSQRLRVAPGRQRFGIIRIQRMRVAEDQPGQRSSIIALVFCGIVFHPGVGLRRARLQKLLRHDLQIGGSDERLPDALQPADLSGREPARRFLSGGFLFGGFLLGSLRSCLAFFGRLRCPGHRGNVACARNNDHNAEGNKTKERHKFQPGKLSPMSVRSLSAKMRTNS